MLHSYCYSNSNESLKLVVRGRKGIGYGPNLQQFYRNVLLSNEEECLVFLFVHIYFFLGREDKILIHHTWFYLRISNLSLAQQQERETKR